LQPTGHRRWPGAHWPGVRQHTAERATVFVWWVVSRTAEPRLTERRGRGYLNRVGLVSPARFLSTAFRVLGLVPVPAAPSPAAPGQSPASRRKSASAQIQPGPSGGSPGQMNRSPQRRGASHPVAIPRAKPRCLVWL